MRALVLAFAALPLAACSACDGRTATPGSGSGTTRSYSLADFTGIDLRGSDNVDVRVGTGFSVRAEGPVKQLDRLRITREGDMLRIGRIDGMSINWGDSDDVTIYVTMPRIVATGIAGSGNIKVDRIEGQSFAATIAGSGDLDVGALAVTEARLETRGSGGIRLNGTAGALAVDVAGSGDVDAGGVKATSATVSVKGSGSVKARVNGAASVSVMGSGDVDLGPGAKCAISKMGSGEVKCGG